MSNSTTTRTIDIADAARIILIMDRYVIVTLYIIGIIGAILNIITFLEKRIRLNPCAVYFLATSIIDFCTVNVFILLAIITTLDPPLSTLIYSTRIWCKAGYFLSFIFPCLSSSYLTLASFDRFCISSLNETLRKWSKLKISRTVVIIVFMIWTLFGLHIPIAYDLVQNLSTMAIECRVTTSSTTTFLIIDGFFFSLYNGAIIPLFLCIFGLLIYYNMKRSRRRVNAQRDTNNRMTTGPIPTVNRNKAISNRNNIHMICMLLIQVILTIILNIPYIVIYLFNFFNPAPTDLLLLLFYIIFSFIARWFYFMNYCKTFYINTLASELFRKSLRQQFHNVFHRLGRA